MAALSWSGSSTPPGSAIGIVLATSLGFFIGIARLSTNWIVAKIAQIYVELIRNIPLCCS